MERRWERHHIVSQFTRDGTRRDTSRRHATEQGLVDGQRIANTRAHQVIAGWQVGHPELSAVIADGVAPGKQHRPEANHSPVKCSYTGSDDRIAIVVTHGAR